MYSIRGGLHQAVVSGLFSGLFLATMLKIIEQITHFKVYTLLLNIDYIPYIKNFVFPEIIEVGFHLIISIALTGSLHLLITHRKVFTRKKIIVMCTSLCFFIGVALFPTTMFSDKTPALSSIPSLAYWLIGHIAYGYVLGELITRNLSNGRLNRNSNMNFMT
ncbi:hypothetical protein MKY34_20050 [Sporosarcina sp. FSL K6-1522]|uniref:hypothetical protein n=1 Tax=Sporosarcina sp. FSL K6-1522 TaxID=2921554 RepID=UPI00315B2CFC